ncbi:MAG: methyltransferase [Gammaproteobacteria bacterium]|nr:methyltransferase [Gammaproteobacteria bacterium]
MKNKIETYCNEHSQSETSLQKKIREYTFKNERYPQMMSGSMVGNFLGSLIQLINAKKILEVGMFTGYSAISMAQYLPKDGELHTCEYMGEHIKTAESFFNNSEYKDMIKIHSGLAVDILEDFKVNTFDFIFIDADKINYLNYYKRCMYLLKKNGVIVLDNMLWSGEVIDPKNEDSKILRETGDYIQSDERVINNLFPIRDGLMVCIKK